MPENRRRPVFPSPFAGPRRSTEPIGMKLTSPVQRKHSRIEIIPLIDIMFFLLASFMMVSLQLHRTHTLRANLPTATQAHPATKPDIINLAVDTAGEVAP